MYGIPATTSTLKNLCHQLCYTWVWISVEEYADYIRLHMVHSTAAGAYRRHVQARVYTTQQPESAIHLPLNPQGAQQHRPLQTPCKYQAQHSQSHLPALLMCQQRSAGHTSDTTVAAGCLAPVHLAVTPVPTTACVGPAFNTVQWHKHRKLGHTIPPHLQIILRAHRLRRCSCSLKEQ
jgi:hypothetical protein